MKVPQLKNDTIIQGKWGKNQYRVKQKIGEGGIGVVYLVEEVNMMKKYAIKISKDNLSLNREYGLLKHFYKVNMIVNAYEIDDCIIDNEVYYYILLEYVDGVDLKTYAEKNNLENTTVIGIIFIILKGLQVIHKEEYIVVDLKLENIMLDSRNQKIKIIDLGGATKKGSTIKEFTPLYDRGSWRCGERVADEAYDLFAAMILTIKLLFKGDISPRKQNIHQIISRLEEARVGEEFSRCIIEGLLQKEISLQYFTKQFENLYNIERINNRRKQILLRNRKINLIFLSSVFLFLATMVLIFIN